MDSHKPQSISVNIDSKTLSDFRAMAQQEGRTLRSLTEEAIYALLVARGVELNRPDLVSKHRPLTK